MSNLILIVEDEPDLVETLAYSLQRAGFQTVVAFSGYEALDQASRYDEIGLVLLDVMLPDLSGLEVCRHLKSDPKTRDVPIIMLTAKGEEIDRVVGFELGADDYVVKPFSVRELVLRVKAVLRRSTAPEAAAPPTHSFGALELDTEGHRVWVSGEEIELTALEFKLLSTLLERKGRVQTRDRLLNDVWGYSIHVTTRTVDTTIRRLREKLAKAEAYIETVRGVGYRFASKPDQAT